jgi:hypothetical protein
MDMVDGRSIALPGIIGAGILYAALACGPAHADSPADGYAFGGTQYSQDYATLTLQVGSRSVTVSDSGFQGWVSGETFNFSGPDPVNTSYIAGVLGGSARNNFFVFNLAGVNGTVTSAKLNLYAGTITTALKYSLYGATAAISQLSGNADSPNPTLYNQLGSGTTYGSVNLYSNINSSNPVQTLVLTLNANAVSDIKALIANKKTQFAISGHAESVPEPSTWITMLAGFAGLGLAAYRRAARGRRTVSAG